MAAFEGQVAIVTGAAQGLGRAFAVALAQAGMRVSVCDTRPVISELERELGSEHCLARIADVGSRTAVEGLVADTIAAFGGIDLLVNNAGSWTPTPVGDPYDKVVTEFETIMNANLKGPLLCSRLCIPHLIARGGGNIINVSTYYVLPARSAGTNPATTDVYNASKWALNGFTQSWALALKEHRIRVNALCMGPTDTPMLRGLFEGSPAPDVVAGWMKAEEVAAQLLALLSEGPEGRTGENIGAWAGETALPPSPPPNRAVTG